MGIARRTRQGDHAVQGRSITSIPRHHSRSDCETKRSRSRRRSGRPSDVNTASGATSFESLHHSAGPALQTKRPTPTSSRRQEAPAPGQEEGGASRRQSRMWMHRFGLPGTAHPRSQDRARHRGRLTSLPQEGLRRIRRSCTARTDRLFGGHLTEVVATTDDERGGWNWTLLAARYSAA